MTWDCYADMREKYYYSDSEYEFALESVLLTLIETIGPVCCDIFGTGINGSDLIAIFLAVLASYMLLCICKSYRNGKIKLEVTDKCVLRYRFFLLRPHRIDKKEIAEITIRENKRKTIIHIRTTKRRYIVKIHDS